MPHYLLVEGKDDKKLFEHLLIGQPDSKVVNCEGQGNLSSQLKVIKAISDPDRRSLKIIFDAESDHAVTFKTVTDSLLEIGFDAPAQQDTWSTGITPALIHLIPGAGSSGCLEDSFLSSIQAERTQEFSCLNQSRTCWPDTPINNAKWSKIFASVLLRTTPDNDDRGVGNALTGEKFRHLLAQKPFVDLSRILALLPPPANA